jgi:hypothetical protein
MLKRLLASALLAACGHLAAAEPAALPPVEIHLPSPCLACIDWGEHLMNNGFRVTYREAADMAAVKRRLKVPKDVESVHTATVGGYFIEGHVPADDIKELLREKPKARGLAVPGLPMGAPGREARGSASSCETGCTILERAQAERDGRRELYDTLLVGRDGKTSIYARH